MYTAAFSDISHSMRDDAWDDESREMLEVATEEDITILYGIFDGFDISFFELISAEEKWYPREMIRDI
jgi:hypothetical protein